MKLDFPHVSKQSESDANPIEKTLNTNIRQRSNRLKHSKVNLHLQAVRSHWRKPNENKFHVTGLQTCSSVKIHRVVVVVVVRCLSIALAVFIHLLLFSSMFSSKAYLKTSEVCSLHSLSCVILQTFFAVSSKQRDQSRSMTYFSC